MAHRPAGAKPMMVVRAVGELREALQPARRAGHAIGLVATMGALHEGHLSLIARARAECDTVVVSLFVNPAQFNEHADLDRYPRQEGRDRELTELAGADLLFAPSAEEVYPAGFSTSVEVLGLTDRLEGAVRGSAHFRGVTTVVTKLLNMVAPDVAYFGQKDAQQVIVIRRLVADLNLPVRIEVCPTVREPDGLAMSSRNAHLSPEERTRALALHAALSSRRTAVSAAGERSAEAFLLARDGDEARSTSSPSIWRSSSPDTLEPRHAWRSRRCLAAARRLDTTDRQHDPASHRAFSQPQPENENPKEASSQMQRVMLKSKIHRATVTDCDLHYVGSITIDPDLLEAADILEHEQVHVVDVDNGARFETYTIAGERGSGDIKVNGAAARLVHRGDTIIVISYGQYDRAELEHYEPRVVHVEAHTNRIITVDDAGRRAQVAPCRSHMSEGVNPSRQRGTIQTSRPDPPCPRRRVPSDPGRLPMTLPLLAEKKRLGEPIVMVTAYDYPSARAAEAAGVDLVLVGDSAATTVLGYNATTPVELDDMLVLARAVRRGLHTPLLIGDLPFGSYEVSDEQAITTAMRMVKEAGCEAVKLEGGGPGPASRARAIIGAGIPVMGRRALTPAKLHRARRLEGPGPHRQGRRADRLRGARPAGQRLLRARVRGDPERRHRGADAPHRGPRDRHRRRPGHRRAGARVPRLLGIRDGLGPRFVKRYANLQQEMNAGVTAYAEDVRTRRYPGPEHGYSIDAGELAELHTLLG